MKRYKVEKRLGPCTMCPGEKALTLRVDVGGTLLQSGLTLLPGEEHNKGAYDLLKNCIIEQAIEKGIDPKALIFPN